MDYFSLPQLLGIAVLPALLLPPDVDLLSQLFLQHLGSRGHCPPLAVLAGHQGHLALRFAIAAVVNARVQFTPLASRPPVWRLKAFAKLPFRPR